ncbi:MAG: peptide chain release factor N(5)-glutamine methyltransferase [Bacteroidetes bacterium]|nr:peptide chain release factor N(5)-glutamine methyltransferase [Bacteroidota bacterium]HOV99414.1 peptide chain release factor N(5)-glutamine methyltransferase [Bacteroidota bacterium]
MIEESGKQWTLRELMRTAIDYLAEKGFDEARLTVELLLSHVLNLQRIELYTNFDRPISQKELIIFRTLFARRLKHEPVQYIVQSAFFMGLQFEVDSQVLIPRPETETLVEEVLLECKKRFPDPLRVLDVGTGSGNIAISVAKYAPNANVTAIDINPEALIVAHGNAQRHQVVSRIEFLQADIFQLKDELKYEYDVIVSNPPYVSVDEWETLQPEVRNFEPRHAITDDGNGFSFYKQLLILSDRLLKPDGLFAVEVGFGQSPHVELLLSSAGYIDITSVYDLQKIPRVIRARKPLQHFHSN